MSGFYMIETSVVKKLRLIAILLQFYNWESQNFSYFYLCSLKHTLSCNVYVLYALSIMK